MLQHCIHGEPVNCPFQFQKRSQLLLRVHDEASTVVAMCVCNPGRSPMGIHD